MAGKTVTITNHSKRPLQLPNGAYLCSKLDNGVAGFGSNNAAVPMSDWESWVAQFTPLREAVERQEITVR